MNLLYACLVHVAAFYLAYCLHVAITVGRQVKRDKTVLALDAHRVERKRFYWAGVLMVLAVLSRRFYNALVLIGLAPKSTWIASPLETSHFKALLYPHLFLDAIAVIAVLAVMLKYNGSKNPRIHGRLVYLVIAPAVYGALIMGLLFFY